MTRVDKQDAPLTLATMAEPIAWFCLRSQPRHEHIAARQLALMSDIEVFNPRIRFARPTRHGPVWVTESLFPNYLFARFDWREALNKVHYAPGVSGIVHFGSRWPIVPAFECGFARYQAQLAFRLFHAMTLNAVQLEDRFDLLVEIHSVGCGSTRGG